MKRFGHMYRVALLGSALLSLPATSCTLDQAGLDSLLATLNGFQGNIHIELQTGSTGAGDNSGGSSGGGGGHESSDSNGPDEQHNKGD